jgi:hypothetical protein
MTPDQKRAQQAIFAALDDQLASPESPEVRFHFDRLIALGIDELEVRRMMAVELLDYLGKRLREEEFSYADYVESLARLPASIDDEFEEDLSPEDAYFGLIIFEIETRINAREREARTRNIMLNDSQVRSTLNKVRKQAGGGAPKLDRKSERDQLLAAIYDDLLEARSLLKVESDDEDSEDEPLELPTADWVAALRTIEDTIRSHSTGPGSRGYLDSLEDFMRDAEKRAESEE